MMEITEADVIGRVLRASTEGFTCGTRSQELEYPSFGAYVQTRHSNGDSEWTVIGLISAIRIDDDPLVRQLIMASNMNVAALRDQRENRLVPVEIDVLNIGYLQGDQRVYNLPPRPPLSLDPVKLCDPESIEYFTGRMEFLRLILKAKGVPVEDLLGAAIREAASARPPEYRREFLIAAGRRLAGLLSHDLMMLQQVLRMIRPAM